MFEVEVSSLGILIRDVHTSTHRIEIRLMWFLSIEFDKDLMTGRFMVRLYLLQ
jgi:hypothetical protein